MDKPMMSFNLSVYDRINRAIIGSIMLIATMATTSIPPWVALLTLYPILTAIIVWDPLYAIFGATVSKIHKRTTDKLSLKGGKLALE
jgi:hypothetical protein